MLIQLPVSVLDLAETWLDTDLTDTVKIAHRDKHTVIVGDFNVDLLRAENHYGTSSFLDGLSAYNLLQTVTRPTRITTHSSTLIDNIFTHAWSNAIQWSIHFCRQMMESLSYGDSKLWTVEAECIDIEMQQ